MRVEAEGTAPLRPTNTSASIQECTGTLALDTAGRPVTRRCRHSTFLPPRACHVRACVVCSTRR